MPYSLRLRVAVGIAALSVLMVSIHSVILFTATDRLEEELVDQIANEELEYFIAKYRSDPTSMPPESEYLKGYVAVDLAARMHLPSYLRDLSPGAGEVFVDGAEHHVVVRDEPDGRFLMAYHVAHHEKREHSFLLLLYVGVVATVLLALALGYWAAGLLIRPVRELARRVDHLGPDRPAVPLAQGYRDEEIQRLARAFDGYLTKVTESVKREQEFTANVSHELRTPLTAIRTSCELLLQEPTLPPSARRRVEAIDRAAGRLTDTARSLLFLARGGEPVQREQVSVQECVKEAAESVLDLLARKEIAFDDEVDASAVLRVDRAALLLVLDNLLRNAALYTERGRVRVGYRDGCLTVEDTGPGIDATELPRIAERFYRGAHPSSDGGLGLGLAIVKRICERFGWALEITSTAGSGTRVAVLFPIPPSPDVHTGLGGS